MNNLDEELKSAAQGKDKVWRFDIGHAHRWLKDNPNIALMLGMLFMGLGLVSFFGLAGHSENVVSWRFREIGLAAIAWSAGGWCLARSVAGFRAK